MPRRSLWVQIGYHMAILSSHPNKHVLNGPDPSTLSPLSWPLNHGCSKNFLTARMLARVRIGLYPISSEKFLICKEPKSVKNPIFLVVKQREISSVANSIVEEAVVGILCTNFPESLGVADLGCSSGPNTFIISSKIIDIVHATSYRLGRPVPELRVSLNDLPGNDFNCIFKALPEFYKKLKEEKGGGFDRCYVSGVPGSFYGRLFPSKSLHFVHSSFSLHWLSQVPPDLDSKEGIPLNKGKLYLSKTSPPRVLEAYLSQFQKDFPLFLKSRAEEMVAGGRMVLTFLGRKDIDTAVEHWDHLALALMSLASEGLVEEEKIDSFNFPYYTPCPKEVKLVVQTDGSFVIDRLETFEYYWDDQMKTEFGELSSGQRIAKTIRAVVESMLECHFGREIMDVLFRRYGEIMDDHLSRNRAKSVVLVVSLIRKG